MMNTVFTLDFNNELEVEEVANGIMVFLARHFNYITKEQIELVGETIEEIASFMTIEEDTLSVDFDTQELDDLSIDINFTTGKAQITEFF